MRKKSSRNNHICLNFTGNNAYFEKDSVIVDKVCPKCKKLILEEKDFCKCGFFLKAAENSAFWTPIISTWLILGIIFLAGVIKLEGSRNFSFKKHPQPDISLDSISPINIQIISRLKNSPYVNCIQNMYVKPESENKLIILIKPHFWKNLTSDKKQEILNLVKKNWEIIYRENYPKSAKNPEVRFANF